MNEIQLDLFTFAAMQTQEKSAEAKPTVVLKNFINDGKYPIPTAKSERIAANLKAIRLLKSLSEERPLEYDEQITLSRFTGWGGLTDVFMEEDPNFAELKELLTKEEYETAESSMLDSYYTPENIIDFMWTIARQKLGVKTGKVAELGCGTGNFIGYAPMQKGLFLALQKAKADFEDTIIPAGFVKINGIEIELNAHCPVENYRVREDKLTVRYHLTGHDFYNRKIKLGSEVTTGNGLITSLKSILAHKAEEAVTETDQLKLNRQRLQQLLDSNEQKVFKYADERIQLQKELDQILYELNEKDLLHEDKTFAAMPRLSDYLDLGIELITQETEVSDDDDESEENEESVRMSA